MHALERDSVSALGTRGGRGRNAHAGRGGAPPARPRLEAQAASASVPHGAVPPRACLPLPRPRQGRRWPEDT
eukprot:scaffold69840_cov46-Phaeocystis_antarctica.AAC.1